jgi:arabinofuranosyltransferase
VTDSVAGLEGRVMGEATRVSARGSVRRVDVWRSGLLGWPVVVIVVAGWMHRWTFDDGFIYFRVVAQIRAGNGPVFNTGERVEVATGTLWLAILTIADVVSPLRLEWTAVLLGIAATAAGVGLATAGSYRLAMVAAPSTTWFVPFGAAVFVAVTGSWIWATSGLETGLTVAWLGGCWWLLSRWATSAPGSMSATGAMVLGIGWLIRPDMVVFSVAFFAMLVGFRWWKGDRRDAVRIAVAMLAVPVAYQIFRMGYYGLLIPNTGIAKEGASGNWGRGWRYLRDFVDAYWFWFPAVVLVAGGYVPVVCSLVHRGRRRAVLVISLFVGCAAVHAFYVVRVGGDYLHARLLMPAFFAWCAPVAAVAVVRRHVAALALVPWLVASFLVLRPAQYDHWLVGGVVLPSRAGIVTLEHADWHPDGRYAQWYSGPGFYRQENLLARTREDDVVLAPGLPDSVGAIGGIGALGYAMGPDFYVFDVHGLAEVVTAHFEPAAGQPTLPRLAGHEKLTPSEWVAARVASESSPLREGAFKVNPRRGAALRPDLVFAEEVRWARAALSCPPVRELIASTNEPMSIGRFVDNVFSSYAHTRLRIPLDPRDAHAQLCEQGGADR